MSYQTLVHRDGRFSRATFVVERDHAIDYAGQSFLAAREVLKGSDHVVVWMDGKWMGDVDHEGRWTFKTLHNPSKVSE